MDGVLIDARDWHYQAHNDALVIFDAEIGRDEHLGRFNGLPTKVKLKYLAEEGRLPSHLHAVVEEIKQERTLREAARMCFPRVEHLLMMSWLRSMDIKIGVATNSIRRTSTTMLQFAGLLESLDVLVTNEDVELAKPEPDIYLRAAALIGLSPQEILVVEDHEYGVQAATAAGCQVIKVSGIEDVSAPLLEPHFPAVGFPL
jgi:beta-phosphoglucomutase